MSDLISWGHLSRKWPVACNKAMHTLLILFAAFALVASTWSGRRVNKAADRSPDWDDKDTLALFWVLMSQVAIAAWALFTIVKSISQDFQ